VADSSTIPRPRPAGAPLHVEEAAAFLGWSVRTLWERARNNEVPLRRPPYSRRLLFFEDELRRFLDGEASLEIRELPGNGRAVVLADRGRVS
jgi:hypothetical protein